MITKTIVYMLWLSIGLYFGVGGYVILDLEERKIEAKLLPEDKVQYNNIWFNNVELMRVYDDEKKALSFFSLIMNFLPKNMIYLITAMAFGILGVITRITKEIAIDKVSFKDVEIYFFPILGMMTGILILAISNIIPNLLVNSQDNLQPLALSFFSLIAGFGSRRFYKWLMDSSEKIFGKTSTE